MSNGSLSAPCVHGGHFESVVVAGGDDPNENESEKMERLPTKAVETDRELEAVMLVSLGCTCGPKLSFKELGRGQETLPFDWMRVTMDGLLHFLEKDFDGFFGWISEHPVPESHMRCFRSQQHSFWHDDPRSESMQTKYARRIKRLGEIDARKLPVLFVRAAATSYEISEAGRLLETLQRRFGSEAMLLLIVDFQGTEAIGPCMVEGHENLMLYYLDTVCAAAPYCEPVRSALEWAAGRELQVASVTDLKDAQALAVKTTWGLVGTGGVIAFEYVAEAQAKNAGQ